MILPKYWRLLLRCKVICFICEISKRHAFDMLALNFRDDEWINRCIFHLVALYKKGDRAPVEPMASYISTAFRAAAFIRLPISIFKYWCLCLMNDCSGQAATFINSIIVYGLLSCLIITYYLAFMTNSASEFLLIYFTFWFRQFITLPIWARGPRPIYLRCQFDDCWFRSVGYIFTYYWCIKLL